MGPDYELSAKFWGAGRSYKRVGALKDRKNMFLHQKLQKNLAS